MASFDSLPYIDLDVSQKDRDRANALIRGELDAEAATADHPLLNPVYQAQVSPLMESQTSRIKAGQDPEKGIDLSRYEQSEETSSGTDVATLEDVLNRAHINLAYLQGRQVNIALLEEYGKNSWLIGNYQLEDMQKRLENELSVTKSQSEEINRSRKLAQEASQGELHALEDTWKQTIGKIIEAQIATSNLKDDLIQKQRQRHTST